MPAPLETIASYWVTEQTLLLISRGDLVDFTTDDDAAIVNAANTTCIADFMRPGNTIDQSISRAGGERFLAARLELPIVEGGDTRCPVGDAKLTSGKFGRLGTNHVIDAVGPNYHDYEFEQYKEADELLVSCYESALERADDANLKQVAFALQSVNDRGRRSLKQLCAVAASAVASWVQANPDTTIHTIILCGATDKEAQKLYESCKKFGFVSEEEANAAAAAVALDQDNTNEHKNPPTIATDTTDTDSKLTMP